MQPGGREGFRESLKGRVYTCLVKSERAEFATETVNERRIGVGSKMVRVARGVFKIVINYTR